MLRMRRKLTFAFPLIESLTVYSETFTRGWKKKYRYVNTGYDMSDDELQIHASEAITYF